MILETIYESIFKDTSHGFRPGRSCHTALESIQRTWSGVKWIIDVDIKGYFDNIDHEILMGLLSKRIQDQRFLSLIRKWLKAGYVEDWQYHQTHSGTPQGGIVSPILANIYLHELDEWAERQKASFDKGKKRRENKGYQELRMQIATAKRRIAKLRSMAPPQPPKQGSSLLVEIEKTERKIKELGKTMRLLPSVDFHDPDYRRFLHCRYADDFIIGIIGSKEEAKHILNQVKEYLRTELKLDTSEEKTRINHHQDKTRFLGYDIRLCTGQKL